ncbi:NAD(P)-binding protein [Thermothelomyces heterothallicus CBS 203.75]
MSTKTIIATGASSGLGFELVKQLLARAPSPAYRIVVGARDVARTKAAFDALTTAAALPHSNSSSSGGGDSGGGRHSVTVLPLELGDLASTRAFARQALRAVARDSGDGNEKEEEKTRLDYLLLNAAITGGNDARWVGSWGWCEGLVVNHLSQHYLVHLLREKLVESNSRVVFVSSGAIRQVSDTESLEADVKAGSGANPFTTYSQTKFIQLLGAHWWRRQLKGQATVVAVSPGLIPGTGLGRGSGTFDIPKMLMADAKPIPVGAQSILRAFTRDDFPEDPQQIFLTSWGEWWPKEVYRLTLDESLQDKWCPSKEEIEKEAGLSG